jgi:hypothetical protein
MSHLKERVTSFECFWKARPSIFLVCSTLIQPISNSYIYNRRTASVGNLGTLLGQDIPRGQPYIPCHSGSKRSTSRERLRSLLRFEVAYESSSIRNVDLASSVLIQDFCSVRFQIVMRCNTGRKIEAFLCPIPFGCESSMWLHTITQTCDHIKEQSKPSYQCPSVELTRCCFYLSSTI